MTPTDFLDQIHLGDCVAGMNELPAGSVDLVFADPPFNIGYQYDVYQDSLESHDYLRWSENWIRGAHRALKPDGAFWLAIGDEYAAELKILSQRIGFSCRSWVIWYYTFGVHCKYKFTRSHAHLFHFVKDPANFTFNADDPNLRVPSARQLVYNDKRANSKGRMPDDTWILRPQDLPSGFSADEDVWYFPRVAGTFKERAGFHGCQMPEHLLGRIIRACSHEDDVVLDPFSGSATTAAVAKKLGRRYLAFDMSEDYVKLGTERLEKIVPGDPLVGSADPLRSVPSTAAGKKKFGKSHQQRQAEQRTATQSVGLQTTLSFDESPLSGDRIPDELVVEAFRQSSDGWSVDRVLLDPVLSDRFVAACRQVGLTASPRELRKYLLQLRFVGTLSSEGLQPHEATLIPDRVLQRYRYASEIAWRMTADRYPAWTLDDLVIDPDILQQFDSFAAQVAPHGDALTLRWGALKLRQFATAVIAQAGLPMDVDHSANPFENRSALPHDELDWPADDPAGGIYRIETASGEILYVGESLDLAMRMRDHFDNPVSRDFWSTLADGPPHVRTARITTDQSQPSQMRVQSWYQELQRHPGAKCNCVDLWLPVEA